MNDIWVALIGMLSAVAVAVVTGIFSSRSYLKKQLTSAQKEASARQKLSQERAKAMRALLSCICRELFWITFAMQKDDMVKNGELDKLREAEEAVEQAEARLKEIERNIVIDE